MFGAIEADGTKFVCAVRTGPGELAITQSSSEASGAYDRSGR